MLAHRMRAGLLVLAASWWNAAAQDSIASFFNSTTGLIVNNAWSQTKAMSASNNEPTSNYWSCVAADPSNVGNFYICDTSRGVIWKSASGATRTSWGAC